MIIEAIIAEKLVNIKSSELQFPAPKITMEGL